MPTELVFYVELTCEKCGFAGPRVKFQAKTPRPSCPACGHTKFTKTTKTS